MTGRAAGELTSHALLLVQQYRHLPAIDPFHCKQTAPFVSHHSQPGYVYGSGAYRSKDFAGRGFRGGTIAEAVESSR